MSPIDSSSIRTTVPSWSCTVAADGKHEFSLDKWVATLVVVAVVVLVLVLVGVAVVAAAVIVLVAFDTVVAWATVAVGMDFEVTAVGTELEATSVVFAATVANIVRVAVAVTAVVVAGVTVWSRMISDVSIDRMLVLEENRDDEFKS
jgi:hypothetical protein